MADSHIEGSIVAMESPFVLLEDSKKSFEECATLRAVRNYLSEDVENDFCALHSAVPSSMKETWLLHRDILHALIVPVVALYQRTALLAEAALCSSRQEDLEIAYRADARSAFLSLQCFVHDEEQWCYSRGCPACTTLYTLETESTIRLAITAALLAESTSPTESAASLSSFLPALQRATEADPFWGPTFWTYHHSKASALRDAIHTLMSQASELEALVLSPAPGRSPVHSPDRSPQKSRVLRRELRTTPTSCETPSRGNEDDGKSLPRLQPSPLAQQQVKLDQEQRALLSRAAWQMYIAVAMPASERMVLRTHARQRGGLEDVEDAGRGRSLTT